MERKDGKNFGRYRLIRLLGQGGMAEVYLGEVTGLGLFRKRVAIKRLLPHYQANQRFVTMLGDEANIAAAIRHPNVAQVLDFGEVDGQHFIAMEYVEGPDLSSVLRRLREAGHTLPVAAALYITQGVAAGLHAAHTLKDPDGRALTVVHRDVSPHNILVSYEGAVKLIDFGVAKAENNSTKTKSGVIKGKLQYMSPEQAQAEPLDGRADVFSLGMTLYKLLTGRLPFTGRNEYQIYDQILRKTPAPPRAWVPDLPERVDAIVMRALRKDPAGRFESAGDMARVLQLALWDIDADYGPHELAALLDASRPASDRVDQQDPSDDDEDFFSMERSEPSVAKSLVLADADIDRLTQMSASLAGSISANIDWLPIDALRDPHQAETQAMHSIVEHDARRANQDTVQVAGDHRDTVAVPLIVAEVEGQARQSARESQPLHTVVEALRQADGHEGPPASMHRALTQPKLPVAPRLTEADVPAMTSTAERPAPRRSAWPLLITLVLSAAAGLLLFFVLEPDRPTLMGPSAQPVALPSSDDAQPSVTQIGNRPIVAKIGAPARDADVRDPQAPDASPPTVARQQVDTAAPSTAAPRTAAPKVVKRRQRPRNGYLTISALPWAKVEIDGKRLAKTTPIRRHAIKPGLHTIRLIGPDGSPYTKRVTVRAGRTSTVAHKF
ncbi:MAG: serine/threonine protein kinase [Bradymonadia bacterium]|jgi:serine/threonine protein kinase